MAFITLLAIPSLVYVVNLVACNTYVLRFGITIARVTTGTVCGFMFMGKRKFCFLMFMTGIKP